MGSGNPFDNFLSSAVPFFIFIVLAIVVMIFITSLVKGIGQYFRNKRLQERHIHAKLIAKRVQNRGGHGSTDDHTGYYATFETEKGERLEFNVGGQFYSMNTEGDAGMLTYRGTRFMGFEREQL